MNTQPQPLISTPVQDARSLYREGLFDHSGEYHIVWSCGRWSRALQRALFSPLARVTGSSTIRQHAF